MKNKRDIILGSFIIIVALGTMIFSLDYTSNTMKQNAQKSTVPIIINKKDPKFKIQNWGMNRTRSKKDAMIERMTKN